jgi:hypothetical protein
MATAPVEDRYIQRVLQGAKGGSPRISGST